MKWAHSVQKGRKRNGRLVCMGCCQESMVLGVQYVVSSSQDSKGTKRAWRVKIQAMVAETTW